MPKPLSQLHTTHHDGLVHHPLGSASYVFRDSFIPYLSSYCKQKTIKLRVGTQPNGSPHIGTVVTFATAFAIARRLREYLSAGKNHDDDDEISVSVCVHFVDTAPSTFETAREVIDGVTYQKSLRSTREFGTHISPFSQLLDELSSAFEVPHEVLTQDELLDDRRMVGVVRDVVLQRDALSPAFDTGAETEAGRKFGIRSQCPVKDCGRADKWGQRTVYDGTVITFFCGIHGAYTVDLHADEDVKRLEFNTPLRTLIRTEYFLADPKVSWIQVTGADYAGFYQEQLLWRHVSDPKAVLIVYAPLVVDWAGSKISKSLYVRHGAYEYLRRTDMDYMLSFEGLMARRGSAISRLFDEVLHWIDKPETFFRSYSVVYLHRIMSGNEVLAPEREPKNSPRWFGSTLAGIHLWAVVALVFLMGVLQRISTSVV
ncbi:hypothetical protein FN846DRAFT_147403 [Sphaerosporella brunnea]|uniref:Uncharacterized protein n=1 Tax=Sphaerosporella brunnea TaxID=1250544 RepID=A0A5J5EQL2_9PEZI|nr:hypothetical protein FN846DRAFT_147403 [Sphaerosporella brunnea]